jgi:outer membrane receptor protein involved in Fe transport
MRHIHQRQRSNELLTLTATGICALWAGSVGPAYAQEEGTATVEEVLVTGSRVRRADLQSSSPLSVLDSEQIRSTGSSNIEDSLNMLPQVTPGDTAFNNPGDGIATVDLRALGPARTLVLVNGRRLTPSSTRGVVDLNNIPSALVERTEVVTGGASAVYGSDALAGVVNFVLRSDFDGFESTAGYGVSGKGDGDRLDVSATLGTSIAEGRGNAVLFANYSKRNPVLQGSRDVFAIDVNGGSPTGAAGRFDNTGLNPFPTAASFLGSGGNSRDYAFNAAGGVEPFINAVPQVDPAGDRYNIPPVNYLQMPQEKLSLTGLGRRALTDNVELFVETLYANNRTIQQQAPTPATDLLVSPTNPLLSQQARALLAARPNPSAPAIFRKRFVELGPRIAEASSDVVQINAGMHGELGSNWEWEAYYSYGRTEYDSSLYGDASKSRINASLQGCPPGTEVMGCRVVDFFGPGRMSQDDLDYIRIASAVDRLTFQRDLAAAFISGKPFALPAGDVGVAVGVEYRKDQSRFDPAESGQRGDQIGFAQKLATAGSFDVIEGYAEIVVPLLKDLPLVDSLTFEAGARYADYESVGGIFTHKLGMNWQPSKDIRFRTMFQQATRAPSVFELYQAGDVTFITFTDRCARISTTGSAVPAPGDAVSTICMLQGTPDPRLDASFTQVSRTVETMEVGNEDLEQETARTITVGAVLQPSFVEGFAMTIDYFDIKVEDYINRAFGGLTGVLNSCFASGVQTADAYAAHPACSLLYRDASAQLRGTVPLANTTELETKGWDVTAQYRFDLDRVGMGSLGSFNLSAAVTRTDRFDYNGVNYAGLITVNFNRLTLPKTRSNVRLRWDLGTVSTALTWQYLGGINEEISKQRVASADYFDLTASYEPTQKLRLHGGVSNLLEKEPPTIRNQWTNTDPNTYDALGRYFFVGATVRY